MFPSPVTLKRVLTVIQDFFASVQGAAEAGWDCRGDVLERLHGPVPPMRVIYTLPDVLAKSIYERQGGTPPIFSNVGV